MKKSVNHFLAFITLLALPGLATAQSAPDSIMRSNGRIYVVIAVLLVILLGIFLYMFRVERRLKKLEKESRD
ncbi:CcmD family protein [Niabella drilacis]|uniref:CcmD family protein n=1 Tax=Niabella drilacis (strain DSM 25811 / CCM 8410 / CCUG 62505 / LMG 26954 / E90) TaxID=1285928 RepID=A0A1G6V0P5_NIADE|nr:CcmD family protein [Niabella drilacis]SDD47063.1 CcmD family protein [Niabella drilacis]